MYGSGDENSDGYVKKPPLFDGKIIIINFEEPSLIHTKSSSIAHNSTFTTSTIILNITIIITYKIC
jgi:hypothetical protein